MIKIIEKIGITEEVGGDEGGRTPYSYLQPYIADNLLELLDKKWNPTGR